MLQGGTSIRTDSSMRERLRGGGGGGGCLVLAIRRY